MCLYSLRLTCCGRVLWQAERSRIELGPDTTLLPVFLDDLVDSGYSVI